MTSVELDVSALAQNFGEDEDHDERLSERMSIHDARTRTATLERAENANSVVAAGITVTRAILLAGSAVPLLGNLCTAAGSVLKSVEELHEKADDVSCGVFRRCDARRASPKFRRF